MTSVFNAKVLKSLLRKKSLAQFYYTLTNAPCCRDMSSAVAACVVGKAPKQWHFVGPMALLPVPFFQSTSVKTPWTLGVERVGGSVLNSVRWLQTNKHLAFRQSTKSSDVRLCYFSKPEISNAVNTESFALNSPNGVYYITFSRASPTRVEYPPMKGWVRSPSQGSLG